MALCQQLGLYRRTQIDGKADFFQNLCELRLSGLFGTLDSIGGSDQEERQTGTAQAANDGEQTCNPSFGQGRGNCLLGLYKTLQPSRCQDLWLSLCRTLCFSLTRGGD